MTTYVDFSQPQNVPFQFAATLDGNPYTVTVPWNLYGQRYYVYVQSLDGTLIVAIPRIASPLGDTVVNLVAGYFTTSTLVWREDNNQFETNP